MTGTTVALADPQGGAGILPVKTRASVASLANGVLTEARLCPP